METGQLRALARYAPLLAAVAATESVGGAADELGIPQPSASRGLKALSEALGIPIVQPDGRTIRLTPAGQELARAAQEAVAALRLGIAAARTQDDLSRTELSVAFQTQLGERLLPRAIGRYRSQRPHVTFSLIHGSRDACIEAAVAGEVMIALVADPPELDTVEVLPLYVEPLVAVVPAGHPLASTASVTAARLLQEPSIRLNRGYGLHDSVLRLLGGAGPVPEAAFHVDDYRVARGLAAAGLGVAILPRASGGIGDGTVEIPIEDPLASRTIAAVVRPEARGIAEEFLLALAEAGR
ncbi:LysR family transcriptional regulator [Agromyces mediolanus]|uniref:LysR family transcriptional regulator n=1 Tax=Agromyces mediolanus TaxID=41986 RepID=UPI0038365EC0